MRSCTANAIQRAMNARNTKLKNQFINQIEGIFLSYLIAKQKNRRQFKTVRLALPGNGQTNNAQEDPWLWVKLCTATFSGASVSLLLLGYGVAIAVEDRFGIARASLYSGASDLLELSSIAVEMLLRNVATLWDQFLWNVLYESLPTVGWMLLIWAILLGALWFSQRRRGRCMLLSDGFSRLRDKVTAWPLYFKKCLLLGALIVTSPLMAWLLFLGVLVMLFVPLLLVAMGMAAGQAYIERDVLRPEQCASIRSVEFAGGGYRSSNGGQTSVSAHCLGLEDEQGKELARGRLVLASPKAVVLVLADKQVKRFDLGQKVVKQVDTLTRSNPDQRP